jgi:hypothetical protein
MFSYPALGCLKSKANYTGKKEVLLKRLPRRMLHYGRGRPRGQRQSLAEMTRLWYLIMVSDKYGLDTHKFLMCFPNAWTHEKSSYNGISIRRRQRTKNNGVFLVTQDQKVIAQLHLSQRLLKYLPEVEFAGFPLTEFTPASKMETLETTNVQIKDIDAGVKRVNLIARVVGKSSPRNVFSRFGGPLALSIATISDGTGSITLPLWNAQIDRVSIGDTVQIENGRVRAFRGELQVSVGRKSNLQVMESQSTQYKVVSRT